MALYMRSYGKSRLGPPVVVGEFVQEPFPKAPLVFSRAAITPPPLYFRSRSRLLPPTVVGEPPPPPPEPIPENLAPNIYGYGAM